jgi:hypothetical protein
MLAGAVASTSSTPPPPVTNSANNRGPTVSRRTAGKRGNIASRNVVKRKRTRLGLVNNPGFVEIDSSFDRTVVWYYRRNTENITNYRAFLHSVKSELCTKLNDCAGLRPIKYNLKLEGTYNIPDVESSLENRAFKTVGKGGVPCQRYWYDDR